MKNKIAMDVESATGQFTDVCQIALVSESGEQNISIRPPGNFYYNRLLREGMNAEATRNSPSLKEVLPDLRLDLAGRKILIWNGGGMERKFLEWISVEEEIVDVGAEVKRRLCCGRQLSLTAVYESFFKEQVQHSFDATEDAKRLWKIAEVLNLEKKVERSHTIEALAHISETVDDISFIVDREFATKENVDILEVPLIMKEEATEILERRILDTGVTLLHGIEQNLTKWREQAIYLTNMGYTSQEKLVMVKNMVNNGKSIIFVVSDKSFELCVKCNSISKNIPFSVVKFLKEKDWLGNISICSQSTYNNYNLGIIEHSVNWGGW